MLDNPDTYLQPSKLCDFDNAVAIRSLAKSLTETLEDNEHKVNRIFAFSKNITYRYDDWDVPASETLKKGWGMCSGKANLLVAMLRSIGIPSRYVVLRCHAEIELFRQITKDNDELKNMLGEPYLHTDHVVTEVFINGWREYDPARDPALERGFGIHGIPVEIHPVDAAGDVRTRMATFDSWATERQGQVRLPETRKTVLEMMNSELDAIRSYGI